MVKEPKERTWVDDGDGRYSIASDSFHTARSVVSRDDMATQTDPPPPPPSASQEASGNKVKLQRLFSDVDDRRDDYKRKRISSLAARKRGLRSNYVFMEITDQEATLSTVCRGLDFGEVYFPTKDDYKPTSAMQNSRTVSRKIGRAHV